LVNATWLTHAAQYQHWKGMWLKNQNHPYGNILSNAGEPGNREFSCAWKYLAEEDSNSFLQLQHDFIKEKYFDVAVEKLKEIGIDILSRSEALQQVVWSRAVQHGVYWITSLFQEAAQLANKNLTDMTDKELIYYIYEVELTDPDWTSGSPSLREGLFNRFRNEREQALSMLEAEGA